MWINAAYASAEAAGETGGVEAFLLSIAPLLILIVLFYFLLIMPQQKRIKQHAAMVSALKKGDKVVTGGGLVAKVAKNPGDSKEVELELSDGVKVTALRATITNKLD